MQIKGQRKRTTPAPTHHGRAIAVFTYNKYWKYAPTYSTQPAVGRRCYQVLPAVGRRCCQVYTQHQLSFNNYKQLNSSTVNYTAGWEQTKQANSYHSSPCPCSTCPKVCGVGALSTAPRPRVPSGQYYYSYCIVLCVARWARRNRNNDVCVPMSAMIEQLYTGHKRVSPRGDRAIATYFVQQEDNNKTHKKTQQGPERTGLKKWSTAHRGKTRSARSPQQYTSINQQSKHKQKRQEEQTTTILLQQAIILRAIEKEHTVATGGN